MRSFIIYGFSQKEIESIKNLIRFISSNIKYITIEDGDFDKTLQDVIDEGKFSIDQEFVLEERVIIFNEIFPKEIDVYLRILKKKVNSKIIFATVTKNSVNMKIRDLFDEFIEERKYFNKNK